MRKKIYIIMLIIYVILLAKLTIFRGTGYPLYNQPTANLELFKNLYYVKSNSITVFLYLLIGNIICFIPLGFFVKEFVRKNIIISMMISFLVSFFIETIQYFTMMGVFEFDDMILNSVGALAGILLWNIVEFLIRRKIRK
jgi:glycopeptide antibiotics resistance protein